MNHYASPDFWSCYEALPVPVRELADKNFALLKTDPKHPSLHFKKVGATYWSARVGMHYRALARIFHQAGHSFDAKAHGYGCWAPSSQIQFVPLAFTGVGGRFAASSRPRFAPIDSAIGLARDARICSQIASPPSRDLVKYPG